MRFIWNEPNPVCLLYWTGVRAVLRSKIWLSILVLYFLSILSLPFVIPLYYKEEFEKAALLIDADATGKQAFAEVLPTKTANNEASYWQWGDDRFGIRNREVPGDAEHSVLEYWMASDRNDASRVFIPNILVLRRHSEGSSIVTVEGALIKFPSPIFFLLTRSDLDSAEEEIATEALLQGATQSIAWDIDRKTTVEREHFPKNSTIEYSMILPPWGPGAEARYKLRAFEYRSSSFTYRSSLNDQIKTVNRTMYTHGWVIPFHNALADGNPQSLLQDAPAQWSWRLSNSREAAGSTVGYHFGSIVMPCLGCILAVVIPLCVSFRIRGVLIKTREPEIRAAVSDADVVNGLARFFVQFTAIGSVVVVAPMLLAHLIIWLVHGPCIVATRSYYVPVLPAPWLHGAWPPSAA